MNVLPGSSEQNNPQLLAGSRVTLARRDYNLGIILLFVVVLLWTSSNFLTQDLFEGGYEKPFLVTYLNTSSFVLYLIPFVASRWWRGERVEKGIRVGDNGDATVYQILATEELHIPQEETLSIDSPHAKPIMEQPPLTIRETAHLAFLFCFLWFIANWSVNASLNYTSVASATILTSMSGFFTLGIGRVFKVEKLTIVKIGAVILSFSGVILVSLSDSASSKPLGPTSHIKIILDHTPHPILGDILALISAFFYALYVIVLKVRIKLESRIDMQLFFGFVGLFNILFCWPIGLVLHLCGVETLQFPNSRKALAAIFINMAITLSSDYLYVLAMLKTTPLVVTVGLSLTIPIAVIGDFFLQRPTQIQVVLGAIFVFTSFVAIGVGDQLSQENKSANGTRVGEQDLLVDVHGPRNHTP